MFTRSRITAIIFFVLILVFTETDSIAQGWPREKGSGYTQLGFSYLRFNSLHRSFNDPLILPRNITDITLQSYAEYGLTSDLTLTASVPFKILSSSEKLNPDYTSADTLKSGKLNAFGNPELRLLYRLGNKGKWVFSAQLSGLFPIASSEPSTGLRSDYEAFNISAAGNAAWSDGTYWFSGSLGGGYYNNNYSSTARLFAEAGRTISEKFSVAVSWELLQSLRNKRRNDGNSILTGMYVNNREYSAYSFKGIMEITDETGIVAVVSGGFPAWNVPQGVFSMIALYYKW